MANFRNSLKNSRIFRIFGWILLILFPLLCQYVLEWFNFGDATELAHYLTNHPLPALFGTLMIGVCYLLLLFLCRRGWLAALILAVGSVLFGLINYVKYALNGNHFFPWDFSMAGDMRELLNFTSITLPGKSIALIVLVFLMVFCLWLSGVSLPRSPWYRIIGAAALVIVMIGAFSTGATATKTLSLFQMNFFDSALQSSNYNANGFIAAFTINTLSLHIEEPEDYSEATINDLLDGYTMSEGTATPDIIVILAESFWDVRELTGTTFSSDPMAIFDALSARDNTVSGRMTTSVMCGGTVTTEFNVLTGYSTECFLTGMSPYTYIDGDLPNCVSLLQNQGYHTVAIHPFVKSFYARDTAYGYLGFDDFYGEEEIAAMPSITFKHNHISDDTFADAIIKQLETTKAAPSFIFGISMENHQPYTNLNPNEVQISVENDALSEADLAMVTTFTQGIYDMNLALAKLVDYIDKRDRDTILLVFGDHLPSLGNAYQETGLFGDADDDSEEQALLRYGAPFLMTANYDIDTSNWYPQDHNEELTVSSYYLLSLLAETANTDRSPYMNLLLDYYAQVPYHDIYLKMDATAKIKALYNTRLLIAYDMVFGKKYTEQAD